MSALSVKVPSNAKNSPEACRSLTQFLQDYNADGVRTALSTGNTLPVQIFTPSTRTHANRIVEIYNTIYHGSYPYTEMLDSEFVYATFSDPCYWWGVFSENRQEPQQIIGCFTIVTERKSKTAYMRGLNILPAYQGRVGTRSLSYALIYRYFQEHPRILRWYTEARTAHPIVQHLAYTIGARGCALLQGKDRFFGEKESDCLMVAYRTHALTTYRKAPVVLPAFVAPFYHYVQQQYGITESPVYITCTSDNFPAIRRDEFEITITPQRHGYQQIKITDPVGQNFLSCLWMPAIQMLEKFKWHLTDPRRITKMMLVVDHFCAQNNVEYAEIHVPVSAMEWLLCVRRLEWRVVGYLPGWLPLADKNFEDAVVFARIAAEITIPKAKLIPPHYELEHTIQASARIKGLTLYQTS